MKKILGDIRKSRNIKHDKDQKEKGETSRVNDKRRDKQEENKKDEGSQAAVGKRFRDGRTSVIREGKRGKRETDSGNEHE